MFPYQGMARGRVSIVAPVAGVVGIGAPVIADGALFHTELPIADIAADERVESKRRRDAEIPIGYLKQLSIIIPSMRQKIIAGRR